MKILVCSDTHASLRSARLAIEKLGPDVFIHLGDYVSDGASIAEDYPSIQYFQVAGNCDRYHVSADFPEVLVDTISNVRVFMTHGHLHGVKQYLGKLLLDGKRCGTEIVLFGHTHEAFCEHIEDGVWVMNPGSCGYGGGTVGLIEIDDAKRIACKVIRVSDLEEF